jgi:hypothetical protein
MKKFFIVAASIAALAIPAVASANVAVNDQGVGSVGKGDVQSALGLNDAGIQNLFQNKGITFTYNAERVIADYKMTCYGAPDAFGHRIISQPGTVSVEAKANTNKAGKLTAGWDLTGKTGDFTPTGGASMRVVDCPTGSFMYLNAGQGDLFGTTSITGSLKVNGIDLPNTPMVLPAV